MKCEIFNISNWNQILDGETHEMRFRNWINSFGEITYDNNRIKADDAETHFANYFRVSKRPSKIFIEGDFFEGKDGAGTLFAALISKWDEDEIEDEDLGAKYIGTSLVFFPVYKQRSEKKGRKIIYQNDTKPCGLIVALGMGTGGPGPDEYMVSNPGHMRRFEGFSKSIKSIIEPKNTLIWYREEPLLHKPIPQDLINRAKKILDATPKALFERSEQTSGYGQYLYATGVFKLNQNEELSEKQTTIINGFINFYARERGLRVGQANDPALGWYNALFSDISVEHIYGKLISNKNIILMGPPGVRKSVYLSRVAEKFNNNHVVRIQFHANTSYHNFVGGIQPVLKGDNTSFEFYKGPLIKAIEKANSCPPGEMALLIIDEINRSDLASVLGEAINLFEPNEKYKIEIPNYGLLERPENLYVLAAMNSADRNISTIDVAIRRRFGFINVWPAPPSGENSCAWGEELFNKVFSVFLEYGNQMDLNLMPGGYYFLGANGDEVKRTLGDRLVPLLEDYLLENRLSTRILAEIEQLLQELKLTL